MKTNTTAADIENCDFELISNIESLLDDAEINPLLDVMSNTQYLERPIKYDVQIIRSNNFPPQRISFDDVDKYDFNNGFIEYLISEDFVHLYFDFDSISTDDELSDVFDWLDSLKSVFGEYSFGGYTDNCQIANDFGFKLIPDGNHFVSMHAIYYQTRISTNDLQLIMKHTDKRGFHTKGIHKLCDPNVYRLVSKRDNQTTRQLFRHVLSNKIMKSNDPGNKMNAGYLVNAKPYQHIVQIRGNEPIISKSQWSKLFELPGDKSIDGNEFKSKIAVNR